MDKKEGKAGGQQSPVRHSAITIVDGPESLKEKYNIPDAEEKSKIERRKALDELTSAGHEYNEFWDGPEAKPDSDKKTAEKSRSGIHFKKPNISTKAKKTILIVIGAAAATVMAVCLIKEAVYLVQKKNTLNKLAELQNTVLQAAEASNRIIDRKGTGTAEAVTPTPEESQETDATPTLLPEYASLYERNSNLVGWIQIPDTIVNYPVMQTKSDMQYYLERDFDRKTDKNGLPFVDSRSDVFEPTTNIIIYGHSMNSGLMFAELLNYKDPDYYRQHKIIYFDTIYERAEYEVVAVIKASVAYENEDVFRYYNFINADTEEEFNDFITNIKAIEYFNTGITPVYGDLLLTLSTCDRTITNGRLAVIARKIS